MVYLLRSSIGIGIVCVWGLVCRHMSRTVAARAHLEFRRSRSTMHSILASCELASISVLKLH